MAPGCAGLGDRRLKDDVPAQSTNLAILTPKFQFLASGVNPGHTG
jgi:hypothetical protein